MPFHRAEWQMYMGPEALGRPNAEGNTMHNRVHMYSTECIIIIFLAIEHCVLMH